MVMSTEVKLIASDEAIPIEEHFRVSAGPGAGKTHWLINHIKNVLHNSKRLGKTRKIACITYTNIAVEIILNRLGSSADMVEVSTIHSFLYKHIVKPYVAFIAEEYGLNVCEMDGHDEHVVNHKYFQEWIEGHPNKSQLEKPYTINQLKKLANYKSAMRNWLPTLHYYLNNNEEISIKSKRKEAYYIVDNKRKNVNNKCLDILEQDFMSYKKQYWQKGILHHEDVLFFSYQLIERFPFILQVLRAKFPYFFIDEFQDTNPIQAKILEILGQKETIVGIIGDKAQAIFVFQGATPEKFSNFTLPGIVDYQIADNRRSTNQIIDFLNGIRKDISQSEIRNIDGSKPIIIVGDMISSLHKAEELCGESEVCSLSRKNITSNAMKRYVMQHPSENFLDELYKVDSNRDRRRNVIACIKAIELARQSHFKEAIKEMVKVLSDGNDKEMAHKKSLTHISCLLENFSEYSNGDLYQLLSIINKKIIPLPGLAPGKIKTFYNSTLYRQIAICVNINDDHSLHRTIHKAKGAEFDNVLIILKNEKDLDFICCPDLENNEEHRIYYVAASRARENIFISVPSITKKKIKDKINKMGIQVLEV